MKCPRLKVSATGALRDLKILLVAERLVPWAAAGCGCDAFVRQPERTKDRDSGAGVEENRHESNAAAARGAHGDVNGEGAAHGVGPGAVRALGFDARRCGVILCVSDSDDAGSKSRVGCEGAMVAE